VVRGSDPSAVSICDLRVVRGGREVLHGVSAEIAAGSITGLIGPSGCGKSTLLRAIVGVQIVTSGEIDVLGLPAGSPALRRRIGYSTQSPAVYGDLTVEENLRYFATVLGAPQDDVDRVLTAVVLEDRRRAPAGRLSGGQLSRASLAVALLGAPRLLVLDEPTVGLDPVLRDDLWTLFHRLAAQGTTLIVSSHVMDEADRCPSLLLMRDGAILAQDTPAALRARTGTASLEEAFLQLIRGTPREVAP
jgi:ABC-2 type transport system ATP-binding protein